MYEEFYGFKELPFNVTPDPKFLYRSSSHRDALAYITYGVFQKKGFIALTGEVGVGKTTVVNAFVDLFDPSVEVSFVFSTKFPFDQLLYLICNDFGLDVEGMNKAQMLLKLNRFLIEQYEKNRNTVLIIDEAQNLSPQVLEELRMLSNLETRNKKLLQIMLVGQPELEDILKLKKLRQLKQRIPLLFRIPVLTQDDLSKYVDYRLKVAGRGNKSPHFTKDSIKEIYHYSKGIPRLINVLCDRVLLAGYVSNVRTINASIVREGIRDLENETVYTSGRIGKTV
ncbi:MAG TPA: XrtA/PEP-CTERM system-associated ATPase [Candidatus Krumholzibacteriaceae bacterium]|nr:XrtA/PEP-CTERM system-associated ATPase [Candidatus Krumholzibacteriaceae bacterium]